MSISKSSFSRTTSLPSKSNVRGSPALILSIALFPSRLANASLILPKNLPYFGPTVLSCGLNEYDVNALTSSVNSTSFIFNSSVIISWKNSGKSKSAFTNILPIGCLFLMFDLFLQARPRTTTLRTLSIFSSNSLSI